MCNSLANDNLYARKPFLDFEYNRYSTKAAICYIIYILIPKR